LPDPEVDQNCRAWRSYLS